MTAAQFRATLDRLGLSVAEAARRLARDPSTLHRWLRDEIAIPKVVEQAVERWEGGDNA